MSKITASWLKGKALRTTNIQPGLPGALALSWSFQVLGYAVYYFTRLSFTYVGVRLNAAIQLRHNTACHCTSLHVAACAR